MRTGLGAFPFGGFHWFGLPSRGAVFSFGPVVCSVPFLWLLW